MQLCLWKETAVPAVHSFAYIRNLSRFVCITQVGIEVARPYAEAADYMSRWSEKRHEAGQKQKFCIFQT